MVADTIPPSQWIPVTVFLFVCFVVNAQILKTEWTKRKSNPESIIFTSKYAKVFPLCCMACGTFACASGMLQFLPIACYVTPKLYFMLSMVQGTFMGFYQVYSVPSLNLLPVMNGAEFTCVSTMIRNVNQLDRLYFCFSSQRVYSKHGYPDWLFVAMCVYGLLVTLSSFQYWFWMNLPDGKCYLDANLVHYDSFNLRGDTYVRIVTVTTIVLYELWDLFTLFLYAYKVGYIRRYASIDKNVHARIMRILQRILILTISYSALILICMAVTASGSNWSQEVMPWQDSASVAISYFCVGTLCVAFSIAIFLMQEHNESEYLRFLQILRKTGLMRICCSCCVSMVEQESEKDNKDKIEGTLCETHDNPVKMEHSQTVDLSIEETSVNRKD